MQDTDAWTAILLLCDSNHDSFHNVKQEARKGNSEGKQLNKPWWHGNTKLGLNEGKPFKSAEAHENVFEGLS